MYCGEIFGAEDLTVDHVQPRMRGGDHSGGNLVTACRGCNTRKGHRPLAAFLASEPEVMRTFFRLAVHVWTRHLRAVREELERRAARERDAPARE